MLGQRKQDRSNAMKQIFPAIFFIALATASSAAPRASCSLDYLSAEGETLRTIAERAYAAPMLTIVQGYNPSIPEPDATLPAGTILFLPCLHGLPQFSPVFPDDLIAEQRVRNSRPVATEMDKAAL